MRFPWNSVWLIAFHVMSLTSDSFEELIMIKDPVIEASQHLTCVTEDDGSALVMNINLQHLPDAKSPVTTSDGDSQIVIDNSSTYMKDWMTANTLQYPMGPVRDYRWEDFEERPVGPIPGTIHDKGYHVIITPGPKSGIIIFSARGLGDIRMLMCKSKKPSDDSCSYITFPVSPNKTSVISPPYRKKSCEVAKSSTGRQASKLHTELNEPFVSGYEWRTFSFQWRRDLMKIQAYNTSGVFATNKMSVNLENKLNIFATSSSPGRMRYHAYNYYRTTTQGAKLYTLPFHHNERNLCIELLVSLCPECEVDVSVVNNENRAKWTIGTISGDGKSEFGDLPNWSVEKLSATLPHFVATNINLEISAQKKDTAAEGLWAIDRIRKCRPGGSNHAIRKSSTTIRHVHDTPSSHIFPADVAWCQKLSHTKNTVVGIDTNCTHNISSELLESLRKKIDTKKEYQPNDWYKGKFFCDQTGCTCAPGLSGSDCKTACSGSSYGYACRERCGKCASGTCGTITGFCPGFCADHYVPPSCKTKLEAPAVSNVNQTSAILRLPNSGKLNPSKIQNFRFELKTSNESWTELKTRTPVFEITICGLVPGTWYTVRAVMLMQIPAESWVSLKSPEQNFSTSSWAQPTLPNNKPCIIGTCHLDDQNVTIPPSLSCMQNPASNNPLNLKVIDQGKGHVTLKWYHPPYTCTQISRFEIRVDFAGTNLQNYSLQQFPILEKYVIKGNEQEYAMDFNLLTSSCYNLSVKTINAYGPNAVTKTSFQVPSSVGFSNGEAPIMSYHENFIKLLVPAVANATEDGRILIVVKGSLPCNTYAKPPMYLRKFLNMTAAELGWIAKNLSFKEINSPKNLTIGHDPDDITPKGCPLDIASATYEVVVVLKVSRVDMIAINAALPKNEGNKEGSDTTTIWVTIFFILITCLFLLFIRRLKFWKTAKRMRRQDLVSCSQALTDFVKSRTTCTSPQSPPMLESVNAEPSVIVSTSGAVAAWSRYSHSVNVEDFEDYVKDSVSSGLLKSQYAMFPRGLIRPSKYGSLPENKSKNRYPNIVAYDDTRVVLKKIPNDRYSDYINANHVQSFDKTRNYIAAQGPKPQTVVDFWRMIWQVETPIICMLTNIVEGPKVKCVQYWPEFGEKKTYGDIVIVTEKSDVFADYTVRTFRVSRRNESRKIQHLHFTGWPDHSVPMYTKSVIKYLKKLQAISVGNKPIIVHCSAGIGRTGTIILCDICSRQAIAKGTVDVLAEFKKLRDCRMNLVDNELQYMFAHVVLVEFLVSPQTELDCNSDLPQATKAMKKKLPQHMERLRNIAWQDQLLQFQFSARPPNPEQLAKNRFPELAPASADLVFLTRYPTYDNNSDYINAVVVDGARVERQYLASQLPLPSTLADFWRLIAELRIELVVLLQAPDPHDPTCCNVIPGVKEPLNPVPFISVEFKAGSGPEMLPRAVELLLRDTSGGTERTQRVHMLTCIEWAVGRGGKPPPPNELVELWTASENVHREEGPTLVLCHDGITGCGLFLALSFMLERMAVERECDVIFAVRAIRRARAEFVQSQEQFEYLYDAAAKYVESFETYANFT